MSTFHSSARLLKIFTLSIKIVSNLYPRLRCCPLLIGFFVCFYLCFDLFVLFFRLPDLKEKDMFDIDNTCLICLQEIKEGKQIN